MELVFPQETSRSMEAIEEQKAQEDSEASAATEKEGKGFMLQFCEIKTFA